MGTARPTAQPNPASSASKDQKLAAIITPAAKPNMLSSSFLLASRTKNTIAAPRAVIHHVKSVARKANQMGFCPSRNSHIGGRAMEGAEESNARVSVARLGTETPPMPAEVPNCRRLELGKDVH